MEEWQFQGEVKNYKVVRRADFHKVYYSKKYQTLQNQSQSAKQGKAQKGKGVTKEVSVKSTDANKGFWELFETSCKGTLTPVELNRFLAAVRQVCVFVFPRRLCIILNYILFRNIVAYTRN